MDVPQKVCGAGGGFSRKGGEGGGAVGEVLLEERAEVRVLDERVLAAVLVGRRGGVLPDPLDVFALLLLVLGRLAGSCERERLRGHARGGEEESGGELEEAIHDSLTSQKQLRRFCASHRMTKGWAYTACMA